MCSMEFIPERSCWSARYTCTVHNCIILLTWKSFCFIVSCRDAFHYVQQRRFCINPNEGFVQQLMVSDEFVGCALTSHKSFLWDTRAVSVDTALYSYSACCLSGTQSVETLWILTMCWNLWLAGIWTNLFSQLSSKKIRRTIKSV